MKLKEILTQIKGVTKDDIQYWVKQGYIRPKKIKKARIYRLNFSKKDFEKIKLAWGYYRKGFPPKNAIQQAQKDLKEEKTLVKMVGSEGFLDIIYSSSENFVAHQEVSHTGEGKDIIESLVLPVSATIKKHANENHWSLFISIYRDDKKSLEGIVVRILSEGKELLSGKTGKRGHVEFKPLSDDFIQALKKGMQIRLIVPKTREGVQSRG